MPCGYAPRQPQETALWKIVRDHLGDFFRYVREHYAAPIPNYVKQALSQYLKCGDFNYGFALCECDACNHQVMVAFSCKQRTTCPSCASRRMCSEAAHITDRVLPNVPIRQWVLSLPMELRGLCATDPVVMTAMNRIFTEEVSRRYKKECGEESHPGSISCLQRFGGSLNLNVHIHSIFLDGAFASRGESLTFAEAPVPTQEEIHTLVVRIHTRAIKWLRRHGYMKEKDGDGIDPTPLQAMTQLAMSGGNFLESEPDAHEKDEHRQTRSRLFAATYEHFDLHCGVCIKKNDDAGREKLVRYCARPVLALDRLEILPDGNISYRVKYSRRGRTHRIMTPIEFIARLAILIPPPFYPLIRYAGILGPGAKLRDRVIPKPCLRRVASGEVIELPEREKKKKEKCKNSNADLVLVKEPEPTEWNMITLSHWERLGNGALVAATRTIDWRTLLARTFGPDVLKCPKCNGRLRVVATVVDRNIARQILARVKQARDPPS